MYLILDLFAPRQQHLIRHVMSKNVARSVLSFYLLISRVSTSVLIMKRPPSLAYSPW